jgi:hypothetical protein
MGARKVLEEMLPENVTSNKELNGVADEGKKEDKKKDVEEEQQLPEVWAYLGVLVQVRVSLCCADGIMTNHALRFGCTTTRSMKRAPNSLRILLRSCELGTEGVLTRSAPRLISTCRFSTKISSLSHLRNSRHSSQSGPSSLLLYDRQY